MASGRDVSDDRLESLSYAVPSIEFRPSIGTWVAAGAVWLAFGLLLSVGGLICVESETLAELVLGATVSTIAGVLAYFEWLAVVRRSGAFAWLIAIMAVVPSAYFALTLVYVVVTAGGAAISRGKDLGALIVFTIAFAVADAAAIAVMVTHVRWAMRLGKGRTRE